MARTVRGHRAGVLDGCAGCGECLCARLWAWARAVSSIPGLQEPSDGKEAYLQCGRRRRILPLYAAGWPSGEWGKDFHDKEKVDKDEEYFFKTLGEGFVAVWPSWD